MTIKFQSFFLPNSSLDFLTCICYLLIFITSYNRFNALAENYGPYDAPENARPWTTWLRYHAAAAIYACLFSLLFAVVLWLISFNPSFLSAIAEWIGLQGLYEWLQKNLSDDIQLLGPVFTLIVLTWGVEKYSKAIKIDLKIRHFFQRLGSIPGAVSGTVRAIKSYELEVYPEECIGRLSEYFQHGFLSANFYNKPKSLEHIYLRVCYLYHQINRWNSVGSPFFQFKTAYQRTFDNINTKFEKLDKSVEKYYKLKMKFEDVNRICNESADDGTKRRCFDTQRKVLTELHRDLREELKLLLENIYVYLACAIHSEGLGKKSRKKLLESMGFKIIPNGDSHEPKVNFNDLAILTVFLLLVIPFTASVCRLALADKVSLQEPITYAVWSLMALYVGIVSVVTPQLVSQAQQRANNTLWKYIRPLDGRRPWCSFLIGGLISGLASICGLCILSYLEPSDAGHSLGLIIQKTVPWGLVPFAVTFTLGYHLERKPKNERLARVYETATTGFFAVLAAVLALYLNSGMDGVVDFQSMKYFSLSAAALLGGLIGGIFPARYRRQKTNGHPKELSAVNLKSTIQDCLHDLDKGNGEVNHSVQSEVDSGLEHIMMNQAHLKRAIQGMLTNAMLFSPENSEINISAKKTNSGGIRLAVKDRGIGMEPEKIKTIVDVTEDDSRASLEDLCRNSDANLIQIKSIAESHGGRFDLRSNPWEGTEVAIELPEKILLASETENSLRN